LVEVPPEKTGKRKKEGKKITTQRMGETKRKGGEGGKRRTEKKRGLKKEEKLGSTQSRQSKLEGKTRVVIPNSAPKKMKKVSQQVPGKPKTYAKSGFRKNRRPEKMFQKEGKRRGWKEK